MQRARYLIVGATSLVLLACADGAEAPTEPADGDDGVTDLAVVDAADMDMAAEDVPDRAPPPPPPMECQDRNDCDQQQECVESCEGRICSDRCATEDDCSSDWACVLIRNDGPDSARVCVPPRDCPCEPTPEVCNGLDDDCDGVIDNTAGAGACLTEFPGACETGMFLCIDAEQVCSPEVEPGAQSEACNGVDDDCNGIVDDVLITVRDCGQPEVQLVQAPGEPRGVDLRHCGGQLAVTWIDERPGRRTGYLRRIGFDGTSLGVDLDLMASTSGPGADAIVNGVSLDCESAPQGAFAFVTTTAFVGDGLGCLRRDQPRSYRGVVEANADVADAAQRVSDVGPDSQALGVASGEDASAVVFWNGGGEECGDGFGRGIHATLDNDECRDERIEDDVPLVPVCDGTGQADIAVAGPAFVVAYAERPPREAPRISARRLVRDGEALVPGVVHQVDQQTGEPSQPTVDSDRAGLVGVAWRETRPDGTSAIVFSLRGPEGELSPAADCGPAVDISQPCDAQTMRAPDVVWHEPRREFGVVWLGRLEHGDGRWTDAVHFRGVSESGCPVGEQITVYESLDSIASVAVASTPEGFAAAWSEQVPGGGREMRVKYEPLTLDCLAP